MTDSIYPADDSAGEASGGDSCGGRGKLVATVLTALLLALGLSVLVALWWRRGGPRAVITELAEQGAVRLADKVVDEVLGAA
jgi:hypothetical protein